MLYLLSQVESCRSDAALLVEELKSALDNKQNVSHLKGELKAVLKEVDFYRSMVRRQLVVSNSATLQGMPEVLFKVLLSLWVTTNSGVARV